MFFGELGIKEPEGFGSIFSAAANVGADSSLDQPRAFDTVPVNALQSMQPVSDAPNAWSGFWGQVLGRVASTELSRYEARRGVTQNGSPAPGYTPMQPATASRSSMMPWLIVGGGLLAVVAVVALRKG